MEKIENIEEVMEEIAEEVGGTVRDNYSGRFMYGSKCYGIDCDSYVRCLEVAGSKGVTGAKVDNMGLGWIVYWPQYSKKEE
jgi:hypothetical protein